MLDALLQPPYRPVDGQPLGDHVVNAEAALVVLAQDHRHGWGRRGGRRVGRGRGGGLGLPGGLAVLLAGPPYGRALGATHRAAPCVGCESSRCAPPAPGPGWPAPGRSRRAWWGRGRRPARPPSPGSPRARARSPACAAARAAAPPRAP